VTLVAEGAASGASGEISARTEQLARDHGLSRRQAEVLTQLALGKTNNAIAAVLGCADGTVEFHVSHLLRKMHCENRTEIVARYWSKRLGRPAREP